MGSSMNGAALPRPSRVRGWRVTTIILCGCLITLLAFGPRATFGFFTNPLSTSQGWSVEVFAFAIALQNLLWGLCQPLAGAVADRYGSARVLVVGGLLYAAGMALMAVADSPVMMYISGGLIVGVALACASFTVVLAALGRLVPAASRSRALGVATAAASLGQFVFAPLGQAFISAYGWHTALFLLAAFMLLVPALAPPLAGRSEPDPEDTIPHLTFTGALRQAAGHRSFQLLNLGFFVCGFHVAFITMYLPPYLTGIGVSASVAAWAIAAIGLFNVIGAYTAGVLGQAHSKRLLLSGVYTSRAIAITLFLSLPKSPAVILSFAAVMGLLWLATVPLTSGLVDVMFGNRYLGTLFGVVFFSHQLGAFTGIWLGGAVYAATGSYDPVWWIAIALGLFSAAVHLPIRETRAPLRAAGAAP